MCQGLRRRGKQQSSGRETGSNENALGGARGGVVMTTWKN